MKLKLIVTEKDFLNVETLTTLKGFIFPWGDDKRNRFAA